MAARLAPDNVRRTHQSLHHVVADAPWSDEDVLVQCDDTHWRRMLEKGPVAAWVVDDTGFVKKGTHSVGVARQYCGQVGKQENCRVAVSLSVSTATASLPVAWRLYLPESWAQDAARRKQAGVPEEIVSRPNRPSLSSRFAARWKRESHGAGAGRCGIWKRYPVSRRGHRTELALRSRGELFDHGLEAGGRTAAESRERKRRTPAKRLRRDADHQPLSVLALAQGLPKKAWKNVTWREGTKHPLRSRFALLRVRPAHRDEKRTEPRPEEWLLIEWPKGEAEPTKYWLSTLPVETKIQDWSDLAKQRWIIERDYQELKQELGLGHFEGRGWRGFHHHATLCIAAYGFLVAERSRFSPSARAGQLELRARNSARFPTPRFAASAPSGIIRLDRDLRIRIARFLLSRLPCCPFVALFVYNTVVLERITAHRSAGSRTL